MYNREINLSGRRVMIVDDTPTNIELLSGILEGEGYRIQAAISGEVALETAARTPPHLILLDVVMPGMDGFETCARLKQDPVTRDIPVVFVTAKSDSDHMARGFREGGVDYITNL